MQHPASPAVARPSCQTLGVIGRISCQRFARVNSRACVHVPFAGSEPRYSRSEQATPTFTRTGARVRVGHPSRWAAGEPELHAHAAPAGVCAGHPSFGRLASPCEPSSILRSGYSAVVALSLARAYCSQAVGLRNQRCCIERRAPARCKSASGMNNANTPAQAKASAGNVHRQTMTPNPSIEGTCNIWLRQLSPAPHVKR